MQTPERPVLLDCSKDFSPRSYTRSGRSYKPRVLDVVDEAKLGCWQNISVELLQAICLYLDEEALLALRQVCWAWHQGVSELLMSASIHVDAIATNRFLRQGLSKQLTQLIDHLPHLSTLTLNLTNMVQCEVLNVERNSSQDHRAPEKTLQAVASALQQCPQLQSLVIHQQSMKLHISPLSCLTQLRALDLSNCLHHSEDLPPLALGCSHLSSLKLPYSLWTYGPAVRYAPEDLASLEILTGLRRLHIGLADGTDEVLSAIGRLTALTELKVRGNFMQFKWKSGIPFLQHLTELRNLKVLTTPPLLPSELYGSGSLGPWLLSPLAHLTCLEVNVAFKIENRLLEALGELKELRMLQLNMHCMQLPPGGGLSRQAVGALRHIPEIGITFTKLLTCEGLRGLYDLPNIKQIIFKGYDEQLFTGKCLCNPCRARALHGP